MGIGILGTATASGIWPQCTGRPSSCCYPTTM